MRVCQFRHIRTFGGQTSFSRIYLGESNFCIYSLPFRARRIRRITCCSIKSHARR
jgi:hypothetical protein